MYGHLAWDELNVAAPPPPGYTCGTWAVSTYRPGDEVCEGGKLYQCKPFPYDGWCGQHTYCPTCTNGGDAWTEKGIDYFAPAPTPTDPNSGTGGTTPGTGTCGTWSIQTYAGGAQVCEGGRIWECKAFPYDGWCGQATYCPTCTNGGDAWTDMGVDPNASAPPPVTCTDWSIQTYAGGATVCEGGKLWECKAFPYDGWCGQATYCPTCTNGGDAWTDMGVAPDGPAPPPSGTCGTWSIQTYAGGAQVCEDGKLWECKPFPYDGWCGQATYCPTCTNGGDAWIDKGIPPPPGSTTQYCWTYQQGYPYLTNDYVCDGANNIWKCLDGFTCDGQPTSGTTTPWEDLTDPLLIASSQSAPVPDTLSCYDYTAATGDNWTFALGSYVCDGNRVWRALAVAPQSQPSTQSSTT